MKRTVVKKTTVKTFAILLAFLLAFSPLFGLTSFAEETEQNPPLSETQVELYMPDEADVTDDEYPADSGNALVENGISAVSETEAETEEEAGTEAVPILTDVKIVGRNAVLTYEFKHQSNTVVWGQYRVKGNTDWIYSAAGATSGTEITVGPLSSGTAYEFSLLLILDGDDNPENRRIGAIMEVTTDTINVTGISLNRSSAFVHAGTTVQLTATVTPNDATDKSVTWSSSDEAVATVSATGLVSAVSGGAVTITAAAADGSFAASCGVTVVENMATGVTATMSVSAPSWASTIGSGGELYAKPGEVITLKLTLTATGGDAYGFATGLQYNAAALNFIGDDFAEDNPEITIAETGSGGSEVIWLSHDSNGKDAFLEKDVPFTITLKFVFPYMTDNSNSFIFGNSTQNTRIQLLISPDLRLDDLRNESGAFLAANSFSQDVLDKTVRYASQVWCRVYATAAAAVAITAIDESNVGAKIGDVVKTKLTITPDKDAYGFVVHVQHQMGAYALIALDTSAWETDNPSIPRAEIISDGVLRITAESDGATKILKAGQPFDIIVRFKVTNTIATNASVFSEFVGCVFTDPAVRSNELFSGDTHVVWRDAVRKAETDGKVDIVGSISQFSGFQITGGYVASVKFGETTGVAGVGSPNIEVSAVITPPDGKAVYGFSAGISYYGYYFALDEAATKAKNAESGLTVGFFESEYTETTYTWQTSTQQIYVESNGTKLADAGEKLTFTLVFRPKSTNAVTNSAVNAVTQQNGNRVVLFTDPSVRAIEEGAGLTTIFFGMSKIQAAEKAGLIAIANPAAGSITTTKQLELDTDGTAYILGNAEDFQKFANAVNSGLNAIIGSVSGTVTLPDNFTGIGTAENPFCGALSYGTVVVNRTVSGGNNSVIGGIVNYLGEGGLISNMTVSGTVTVTGVTGTANIGGVVGVSDGGSLGSVRGNVNVTATDVSGNVGGIAGSVNKSKYTGVYSSYWYAVISCKNSGAVSGGTNTGGIVGLFSGERGDTTNHNSIYSSANTGAVSGVMNSGGIVGNVVDGIVRQCRNADISYGNVSGVWGDIYAPGGDISGANAGGIAGIAADSMFDNCSNTESSVTGTTRAGGIAGHITGATDVDSCWVNAGTVTSPGGAAGGIIGETASSSARITNNFNIGTTSEKGITGAASAAPAKYTVNCYIGTAADGDALNAIRVDDPDLFIVVTARSSNTVGRYAYDAPGEPEQDEDGVWLLKTPEDILWLARKVSANTANGSNPDELDYSRMNVKLMNNIDMSGQSFYGIGMNAPATAQFKGIFDGNGFTVTLNVTSTTNSYFGFFNYTSGATIKDLTIDGSINLPSTNVVAGIVANNANQGILTLENCHNKASITAPAARTVGGIVGGGADVRMTDCTNSAPIMQNPTSTGGSIGGIVGTIAGDSVLDNCKNTGAVTGGSQIGGIVGAVSISGARHNVVIKNCENTGAVTSNTPAGEYSTSRFSAGGIVGYVDNSTAIGDAESFDEVSSFSLINCTNSGRISGTTNNLGGILGRTSPGYVLALTVKDCINYGDVISTFSGTNESFGISIAVGGIGGAFSLGYVPSWGDDGVFGIVSGNENHGTVSGRLGSISSIVGSGSVRELSENTTSVVNSEKDQNAIKDGALTLVEAPPPPDNGGGKEENEDPVTPPGGGSGNGNGTGTGDGNGNASGGGSAVNPVPGGGNSAAPDSGTAAARPADSTEPSTNAPAVILPDTIVPAAPEAPVTTVTQTQTQTQTRSSSPRPLDTSNIIDFEAPVDDTIIADVSEDEVPMAESPQSPPEEPETSVDPEVGEITREASKGISPSVIAGIAGGVVVIAIILFIVIRYSKRRGM